MQDDLFGDLELTTPPEPVLMSLKPGYYELMWQGLKTHEFRRRYLSGRPTTRAKRKVVLAGHEVF